VTRLESVRRAAFLALESFCCCHCHPFKSKNLRRFTL